MTLPLGPTGQGLSGLRFASAARRLPVGTMVLSSAVMTLLVYYLTDVAPEHVPIDPEAELPLPWTRGLLDTACAWTGRHPALITAFGLGLMTLGAFLRYGRRTYYAVLTFALSLTFGFAYFSLSRPIDHLFDSIQLSSDMEFAEETYEEDEVEYLDW